MTEPSKAARELAIKLADEMVEMTVLVMQRNAAQQERDELRAQLAAVTASRDRLSLELDDSEHLLAAAREAGRHTHVRVQDASDDACAGCGLDLRNPIHFDAARDATPEEGEG